MTTPTTNRNGLLGLVAVFSAAIIVGCFVLAVKESADTHDASKHARMAFAPDKEINWAFEGYTGTFDRQAAQRGFQVYKEVCSACHGLKRVAFRNLEALGFSEAETKALAAESSYKTIDGEGEEVERPGKPSDRFPSPFANEEAARAANNGAYPPDLSLIVKARPHGADYIYALMTGYNKEVPGYNCATRNDAGECIAFEATGSGAGEYQCTGIESSETINPETKETYTVQTCIELPNTMYYNPYFDGRQIAMAPPLSDGMVTYEDGTDATLDQLTRDVVTFLQWAAEPEMEDRKRIGLRALIFLSLMTLLFYFAMKRVWADIKKK